jgi:hypothetical protein
MKKIPLTQGKFTIVDDVDYPELFKYKWRCNCGYASRGRGIHMHRLIMDCPSSLQVDHINLDTLDNRKCNLRLCTNAQNQHNTQLRKDNTSGYKGVSWQVYKWTAGLKIEGKRVHLGYYFCLIKAAKAYDKAAKEAYGEFARLNFPDKN